MLHRHSQAQTRDMPRVDFQVDSLATGPVTERSGLGMGRPVGCEPKGPLLVLLLQGT